MKPTSNEPAYAVAPLSALCRSDVTSPIKRLQVGFIGRLFGDNNHVALNVTGTLTLALFALLVAIAYFPVAGLTPAAVCPLLTLTIGYLFGDRRR